MVEAWDTAFAGVDEVTTSCADMFEPGHPLGAGVAIVSPANSFGYMDGGIDLVYSKHFGWDVEDRLRKRIVDDFDGELPVGNAVVVATEDSKIPWLVSAPTMRVPMNVAKTANAYLAFRAALIAVADHNRNSSARIDTLFCPGLCTANGRMPNHRAAKQMFEAFVAVVFRAGIRKGGLAGAVRHHMLLVDED